MFEIGIARFFDGVIVDVDDVVEHAHRGLDGAAQLVEIELAIFQVIDQIHRTQIAHGDFRGAGVEGNLGAQIRTVHHAHVLLRRTDVARIFESDPRMAGFE